MYVILQQRLVMLRCCYNIGWRAFRHADPICMESHIRALSVTVMFIISLRHRRESAEGKGARQNRACAVFKCPLNFFWIRFFQLLVAASQRRQRQKYTDLQRCCKKLQFLGQTPAVSDRLTSSAKIKNKKQSLKWGISKRLCQFGRKPLKAFQR